MALRHRPRLRRGILGPSPTWARRHLDAPGLAAPRVTHHVGDSVSPKLQWRSWIYINTSGDADNPGDIGPIPATGVIRVGDQSFDLHVDTVEDDVIEENEALNVEIVGADTGEVLGSASSFVWNDDGLFP